ncbi:hypothetical protein IFT92_19740 [Peribacillus simplex]|nr:hypothetical protein [Peribacillus simplex]
MKKTTFLLIMSVVMLSSSVFAKGKEDTPERVNGYVSTEDILLSLIEPKLNKIVKDQYGKEMIINPLKIHDVANMLKGTCEKGTDSCDGWFQLDLTILVGEPSENPKIDSIILKIDAPNIGGTAPHLVSEEIKDIKVELVKYIKG